MARCARCAMLAHPPDVVCPHCGTTDPGVRVRAGQRARDASVRGPCVRQSFLPGFDDDLPFVLVDVELDEQADLRMIGRLLDGPDAAAAHRRRASRSRSSELADGVAVPAFALDAPVSGRFAARNQVAIVGYAQSPIAAHFDRPLGRRRGRHRPARRSPTPGSASTQVDGFSAGSLLPTAGSHAHRRRRDHRVAELARPAPRRQPALRRRASRATASSRRGRPGGERGRQRRGRLRARATGRCTTRRAATTATR